MKYVYIITVSDGRDNRHTKMNTIDTEPRMNRAELIAAVYAEACKTLGSDPDLTAVDFFYLEPVEL